MTAYKMKEQKLIQRDNLLCNSYQTTVDLDTRIHNTVVALINLYERNL